MARRPQPVDALELKREAENLGLVLSDVAAANLAIYLDTLVKWNARTNLVGPRDAATIFSTLAIDSLHLAPFLSSLSLADAPLTLDLGAGAGLPGIPLRTLWHAGEYHLVEVREKRCVFMRLAVGQMKLPRTYVFQGRAEDVLGKLDPEGETRADLILSRAFMPWEKLLPFVLPMLVPGGSIVILSNDPAPDASEGWESTGEYAYTVAGKERFFWALRSNPEGAAS